MLGCTGMRCTDLKRQRDKAIYECYRSGLEQGRFTSLSSAAHYLMSCPAPRFFIEGRTASLLVGRLLRGESLDDLHPSSRKQAVQLKDNYLAYLREHRGTTMPRVRILEMLVEEPAPEFYIGWRSMMYTLKREIKKVRMRWGG